MQISATMQLESWTIWFLVIAAVVVGLWLAARLPAVVRSGYTTVYEWEHALLYENGAFVRVLPPGRHFTWSPTAERIIPKLHRNDQLHQSFPVDVTSSDRLVFRIAATVTYRIVDAREAYENGHNDRLRLATEGALVRLAAARTLEAFVAERTALDAELADLIGSPVGGCEIRAATVSSVVLPPEIRRQFSEVERARMEGLAKLERARGETAALRALANAARMLKGNPELMNLRVLQTLAAEGKSRPTLVLGDGSMLPVRAGEEPSAPA